MFSLFFLYLSNEFLQENRATMEQQCILSAKTNDLYTQNIPYNHPKHTM